MKRLLWVVPVLFVSCIERPDGAVGGASYTPPARPVGVRDREVLLSSRPTPAHPVEAKFEGIELIGYDTSPEVANRGDPLTITVYYAATEDIHDDWQVFVHLDDVSRTAQRTIGDHYPGRGSSHTNTWRKGDIIRDVFTVTTPMDATGLEFWTGFYLGKPGASIEEDRLDVVSAGSAVNDGQRRLKIGTIPIH